MQSAGSHAVDERVECTEGLSSFTVTANLCVYTGMVVKATQGDRSRCAPLLT